MHPPPTSKLIPLCLALYAVPCLGQTQEPTEEVPASTAEETPDDAGEAQEGEPDTAEEHSGTTAAPPRPAETEGPTAPPEPSPASEPSAPPTGASTPEPAASTAADKPSTATAGAHAATTESPGEGKHENKGANAARDRYSVGLRVMTGFEFEAKEPRGGQVGLDEKEHGFFLSQARLKFKGKFEKRLRLNVSIDAADAMDPKTSATDFHQPPYLRNAYLDYRFFKALHLRAGRFKRPYSRLELRGSGDLQIHGRGLFNDYVLEGSQWGGRGVGAMLHGKFDEAELGWHLALTNPYWAADQRREGYDAIGRLEYEPLDWLEVGVNGGHKVVELAARTVRVNAVGGDVRVKTGGLFVLLESLGAQLPFEQGTPWAYNGTVLASYDVPLSERLSFQPVGFFEYADAHADYSQTEAMRVVVGSNLIIDERFRVMPQVEFVRPVGTVSELNPWLKTEHYYLLLSMEL